MTVTGTGTGTGPITTATATGDTPGTGTGSSVSPTARRIWLRSRGLLVAAAVLVLTGLVLALLRSGDNSALHPSSAAPLGSRAINQLLTDHGVDITVATTSEEALAALRPGTTLLITHPEDLTPERRETLHRATQRTGTRTVLVAAGPGTTAVFAPGTEAIGHLPTGELDPGCTTDLTDRAGSARLGGYGYLPPTDPATDPTTLACYPYEGLPTLLTLDAGTPTETVLLGAPDILHNQSLADHGNASLALQLLGARDHLVWYLPTGAEAPGSDDERSLTQLMAPGWRWAALQLAIAAALAAFWRGRRLGPVLTERLPITVRAAETTEGRARLYHRNGARDRAADALRTATRGRLAPRVGLPAAAAHTPDTLVPALAAHTGQPGHDLHQLLFGPPPPDDPALVALADALDALENRLTPDRPETTDTTKTSDTTDTTDTTDTAKDPRQ
ncbi:DUF4350 domain-containing protein [Streptomyces sp. XM4011]|uniref:DUF4350 domain-containing protein n=1 Tax=Streptomyces sp. XM4011 TaxID=2929780 RepID=UPI001FFAA223|nr:DUF4350 domain-containing protein [Streptomyces sp. XM4011]MCK1816608.1 DUF4350 domain-containing protein [Streptomyces sp. XM4011]